MSFSFFDNLPTAVTLVLGLLLVVWLILLLLVPFMIESIRGWTRRSFHELEEMNHKLDVLTKALGVRADLHGDPTRPADVEHDDDFVDRAEAIRYDDADDRTGRRRADRVRKEPTI